MERREKLVQNGQNGQEWSKWFKMVQNCPEWSNMAKNG